MTRFVRFLEAKGGAPVLINIQYVSAIYLDDPTPDGCPTNAIVVGSNGKTLLVRTGAAGDDPTFWNLAVEEFFGQFLEAANHDPLS